MQKICLFDWFFEVGGCCFMIKYGPVSCSLVYPLVYKVFSDAYILGTQGRFQSQISNEASAWGKRVGCLPKGKTSCDMICGAGGNFLMT